MYKRMEEDMDVNAGEILSGGMTTEELGHQIFNMFLQVASGEKTKSEAQALVTADVEAAQAAWDAMSDEEKSRTPGRPTDITLP